MNNGRMCTGLTKLITLLFVLSLFAGQLGIAGQAVLAEETNPAATPVAVEPTVEPMAEATPQVVETPTDAPTEIPTTTSTPAPAGTPAAPNGTPTGVTLSSEGVTGEVTQISCDGLVQFMLTGTAVPGASAELQASSDFGWSKIVTITTPNLGVNSYTFDFASLRLEGEYLYTNESVSVSLYYNDEYLSYETVYCAVDPGTPRITMPSGECNGDVTIGYNSPSSAPITITAALDGTQLASKTFTVSAEFSSIQTHLPIGNSVTGTLTYTVTLGSISTQSTVTCPRNPDRARVTIDDVSCTGDVTYTISSGTPGVTAYYITIRTDLERGDPAYRVYGTSTVPFSGAGAFTEHVSVAGTLYGVIVVEIYGAYPGVEIRHDCGNPPTPTQPLPVVDGSFAVWNVTATCSGTLAFDYRASQATQFTVRAANGPETMVSVPAGEGRWSGSFSAIADTREYTISILGRTLRPYVSWCGQPANVRVSFFSVSQADCLGHISVRLEGAPLSAGYRVYAVLESGDSFSKLVDLDEGVGEKTFTLPVPANYVGRLAIGISETGKGPQSDAFYLNCPAGNPATPTPTPTVTATPTPKPGMSVAPKDVIPGQSVTIAVTNFDPNATVRLRWKVGSTWTQVGTATTNGSGAGSATVQVPVNAVAGKNTVRAESATKAQQTSAVTVTIPGPPTVTLSTMRAVIGASVSYQATNFLPNTQVTATWRRPGGSRVDLGSVTAGNDGKASGVFTVPATEGGPGSSITFQSGTRSVTVRFDVAPTLSVSPTSVTRGSSVTVSIKGYGKRETVRIRWYVAGKWVTVATIVTTNTGTAQVTIKVPANAPIGPNKIRADGTVVRQQTNAVIVTS